MNSKRSKSTLFSGSNDRQTTMTTDRPQNSALLRVTTSLETLRIMPRTPSGRGMRRVGTQSIMAGSRVRVTR